MPRPPKHGSRQLERLIRENALDGRTKTARMLRMIADDLAEDAGGWTRLTNREKLLIDRTATAAVIMQSIEGWVLTQPGPVDEKGDLLNVLRRGYLAYLAQVTRCLVALGLKPDRADRGPTLEEYIASREQNGSGHAATPSESDTDGELDTDETDDELDEQNATEDAGDGQENERTADV